MASSSLNSAREKMLQQEIKNLKKQLKDTKHLSDIVTKQRDLMKRKLEQSEKEMAKTVHPVQEIEDLKQELKDTKNISDIVTKQRDLMKGKLEQSQKEMAKKVHQVQELRNLLKSSARMISDLWQLYEAQKNGAPLTTISPAPLPNHLYEQHPQLPGHQLSPQQVSNNAASAALKPTTGLPQRTRDPTPPHALSGVLSLGRLKYICTRDGKASIFEGLECVIPPNTVHAAVADLELDSFDIDKLVTRAVEKVRERVKENNEYLEEQEQKNDNHEEDQDSDHPDEPDRRQKRAWRFVEYGLTEDEAASVFMYTAETSFYKELNTCCRNANRQRVIDFFPFLALFTQALQKMPCRRGTFWRAIQGDFADQYKSKSKIVWRAFSSCTADISVMTKFKPKDPKSKSRNVMFSIEDAYGADIGDFCWGRVSEEEILIPPGVEFEVQNKLDGKIDGSSSDIVSLKQIDVPEEAIAALCSTRTPGYPFQTETPSVATIESLTPSLLIKWKLPPSNGHALTNIHVRWRERKQTPSGITKRTDLDIWSYAEIEQATATSCVLSADPAAAQGHPFVEAKLLPKRMYEVGICVENEFGKCLAWSYMCEHLSNVVTTNDCPPEPPLGSTFQLARLDQPQGNSNTMHLSWSPLSFPEDGGSPVTDYEVQFFDMVANQESRGARITKVHSTLPEMTIPNVSTYGRYALRIIARNNVGTSRPSEWHLMNPCWIAEEEVFVKRPTSGGHKHKIVKGAFRKWNNGKIIVATTFRTKSVEPINVTVQMKVCQDEFQESFDAPRPSNNFTPLLNATFMGYFDTVLFLLNAKANVNHRTGNKYPEHSAVFIAAMRGNSRILGELIRAKAELDDRNSFHMRALDIAAQHGHISTVKMLLEAKAQVNAESVDVRSSIHYTARAGEIQCMQLMFAAKANLDARDNSGGDARTPLHMLLSDQACPLNVVQFLLSMKANPNVTTAASLCPITIATIHGVSLEVVDAIIDAKADVNMRDLKKWSPLHFAVVYNSRPGVIQRLLRSRAQIDAQTDNLETALHMACSQNSTESVDVLIKAGASLNARAKINSTPLHYAAAANHKLVLQKLLAAKAEVDARRDFQWTPLHCAVYQGHGEIVFALLRNKASPIAQDEDHETPLHLAARIGHVTLVNILLQAKADASSQTRTDLETPLHAAVGGRCLDSVILLVNAKANLLAQDIFGHRPIDRANIKDFMIVNAVLVSASPLSAELFDM